MKNASKITFIQNNIDRNKNAIYSCLQIDFEEQTDFILLQELNFNIEQQFIISHLSYHCFLSEKSDIKARVIVYARKRSRFQFNIRTDYISNSDILAEDIIDIN